MLFTHHTLYENYTHYVGTRSERMRRFVVELCTGWASPSTDRAAPGTSSSTA
jgi:hypothetical protein